MCQALQISQRKSLIVCVLHIEQGCMFTAGRSFNQAVNSLTATLWRQLIKVRLTSHLFNCMFASQNGGTSCGSTQVFPSFLRLTLVTGGLLVQNKLQSMKPLLYGFAPCLVNCLPLGAPIS